jgi:hypothetical protein
LNFEKEKIRRFFFRKKFKLILFNLIYCLLKKNLKKKIVLIVEIFSSKKVISFLLQNKQTNKLPTHK